MVQVVLILYDFVEACVFLCRWKGTEECHFGQMTYFHDLMIRQKKNLEDVDMLGYWDLFVLPYCCKNVPEDEQKAMQAHC